MKKHWFLIAILGTLISFTSCKKDYENRIVGEWELTSSEGDTWQEKYYSNQTITYIFSEGTYIFMVNGNVKIEGKYHIQNNKLYLNTLYVNNRILYVVLPKEFSYNISFSGRKNMIWIDKDIELKYTLQKIKSF